MKPVTIEIEMLDERGRGRTGNGWQVENYHTALERVHEILAIRAE